MLKNKFVYNSWPFFFLWLVAAVLLGPIILHHGSFLIGDENRHQTYSFLCKLNTAIHHGYLPVWDANTFGGKNFVGEFQSAIFYPLNLLMCILFGTTDYIDPHYLDLMIVLHYFICITGMYALGRVLKLSVPGSIAASLIFTFTGVMAVRANAEANILYGLCLMPWPLYFVSKYYFVIRKKKYLLIAGLAAGMQILSGHIQPFFHVLVICGSMILFYEYHSRKSWASYFTSVSVNFLLILAFAILISLPQLYYSIEYMSSCYRWVGADHALKPGEKVPFSVYAYLYIIKPADILNLLGMNLNRPEDGNNIYAGVLPLFVFVTFLIKQRHLELSRDTKRLVRLLVIIAALTVATVLGYLTYFCIILWEIPFVNTIRELGRYSILLTFCFAILTGLAITNIRQLRSAIFQNSPKFKFYLLLGLAINALYLVIFQSNFIERRVTIPFLGVFLFFLLLRITSRDLLIYASALGVIIADLYVNKVDYWPSDTPKYPTTFFQRNKIINFLEKTYGKYRVTYEIKNNDSLRRNLGDVYNIQQKLGYCATMNIRYFDYISSNWDFNSEVLDLLNVKYIVSDQILQDTAYYTYLDSLPNTYLYERKNCYPRAYWKGQVGKPGEAIEKENTTNIQQVAYSDLYQKLEVECPATDTLIISENNYPGWKCYDNSKEIPIYLPTIKNHPPLFRAIALDKGHHTIEFKYPTIFKWK